MPRQIISNYMLLRPILAIFILSMGARCLKLKVVVPQYKIRGEMALLECLFELEGDKLYSVKWYKEDEEFYRYLPKSNPPQLSYKVDGIKVDHSVSDSRQVALRGVNLKSTGVYRCEVSAEAPSFASAQSEGRMQVVYLPTNGPHISGEEKQYQIGDEINLNCTSGKSFPASTLDWFINDQRVPDPSLRTYPNIVHQHGLVTTILGLRFRVSTQHFVAGNIRVRCLASVSPVLWQGDRESVVQRYSPPLIDKREALLLVKGESRRVVSSLCLLFIMTVLHFVLT